MQARAAHTPFSRGVHARPVGVGHALITGGGTAPLLAQHSRALSAHARTHTASPGVVAGWAAATQWRGWASAHAMPADTDALFVSRLAEFSKIAQATSVGFAIMGFIGFFVKLMFIPINNIIVGMS